MAAPIKNLKQFIAEALIWKADPRHADNPEYLGHPYEDTTKQKGIFSWARREFPEYDKLYSNDNELFTKYFVRDLNAEDETLIQKINQPVDEGDETPMGGDYQQAEEKAPPVEERENQSRMGGEGSATAGGVNRVRRPPILL